MTRAMTLKARKHSIHSAIKSRDLEWVQQLILWGVDIEQRNRFGEIPLGIAVDLGYTEIVKELLEAGAYPELGDWTTPLESAAIEGYIDIIELLLNAGADVNLSVEDGNTALMGAAACGHFEVVKRLVEAGANVDARKSSGGDTALSLALNNAHRDVVKYLFPLTCSEDKEQSVNYGLSGTAMAGKVEVIEILVESDINLDRFVLDNQTALMLAAQSRQVGIVEALVKYGVDVNLKNSDGLTALMFAARFRTTAEASMIIKGAKSVQTDLVKILVEAQANLNLKDRQGQTALSHAAAFGPLAVVKLLLELGADVNSRNRQGKTVLEYALDRERLSLLGTVDCFQSQQIVNLLREAGAKEDE